MAGAFTVTATGTPAPTITKWGTLPEGMTFSGGVLSGTLTQVGTFEITFTASNVVGPDSTQQFTLTVLGLHVTTTGLPEVTPGTHYSQQLTATAGVGPFKWKVPAGELAQGPQIERRGTALGTGRSQNLPTWRLFSDHRHGH